MTHAAGGGWMLALAAAAIAGACGGDDAAAPDAGPPSDNATLSALTASAGVFDPAFEPDVYEYHLDLILSETDVTMSPVAAVAEGATITVDGDSVPSGDTSEALTLVPGSRDVELVVIAASGRSATYLVHVHRGVDALAALVPGSGTLSPAFTPATTAYAIGLPFDTDLLSWTPTLLTPGRGSITVGSETVASGASSVPTAVVTGASTNSVAVTPLSRPGDVMTYAANVVRGADALSALTLSAGGAPITTPLLPAFDTATVGYTMDVGLMLARVQVTATPLVAGATITVAGVGVTPGQPSQPVPLNLGANAVPVVVTAPDGAVRTYTLTITRAASLLQQAYVKASNTDQDDSFGVGVALWGDTLVVGAYGEASIDGTESNNGAYGTGAVYVFTRTGTTWSQQAYLKASTTGANDQLGTAIALWGDTLVVGAVGEDSAETGVGGDPLDNSALGSGAAYVFTRTGTTWSQQAYLKASNTDAGDEFGSDVAVYGDTIAIGAASEASSATGIGGAQADNSMLNSGAVYVFARTGTTWSQQAYVKASNTSASDQFGRSVDLWGDTLVVGAPGESSNATGIGGDQADDAAANSGAVYVFARIGTAWSQQAYVKASNTVAGDMFGNALALSTDTLAVGALAQAASEGAAYVFTRSGTTWSQQAYLKASNANPGDRFGVVVAVWADTLVIGADYEASAATGVGGNQADNSASGAGAAYTFSRSGTTWSQQRYLKASNTGLSDLFGLHVALWGDTAVVGAMREDSSATGVGGGQGEGASASGAAYVFR